MGTLTSNSPKCLIELGGKALLDWQINALTEAGIEEIAIVRGYLGHLLTREKLTYFENMRWDETNMVTSLVCAGEWLQTESCIVSYSDIVYSADAVCKLTDTPGDIAITFDPNWFELWQRRFEEPLSDAETFRIDKNGILLEIGSRAASVREIQGQYMGLLKFTPNGWCQTTALLSELTREECDNLDMTSILQKLILSGVIINTVAIGDSWGEIDNENDISLYTSIIEEKGYLWKTGFFRKQV